LAPMVVPVVGTAVSYERGPPPWSMAHVRQSRPDSGLD